MKISVYITSYNQKYFLKEAIESVLVQTLRPYEIIIIDDASSDGSKELIQSYELKYPKLIYSIINDENLGISKCRTKAIEAASGDFLTWVDGDDAFLPEKLEKEAKLVEDGKYQIAFSNYYFAENILKNLVKIWAYDFKNLPMPGNMFKEVITRSFPWGNLYRSELIELSALMNSGLYDENLKIYEDYDLRIRLSARCNITYTTEPLSIYRQHSGGLSRAGKQLHYDSFKYIFNKYQDLVKLLSEVEKQYVEDRIKKVIGEKRPAHSPVEQFNYTISTKRKVQLKLINLINRL